MPAEAAANGEASAVRKANHRDVASAAGITSGLGDHGDIVSRIDGDALRRWIGAVAGNEAYGLDHLQLRNIRKNCG